MGNINRRLRSLEKKHFGNENAKSLIFAYGGDDSDCIGYDTGNAERIIRLSGEPLDKLRKRAVATETRLHSGCEVVLLHELYCAEYWDSCQEDWTTELFRRDLTESEMQILMGGK